MSLLKKLGSVFGIDIKSNELSALDKNKELQRQTDIFEEKEKGEVEDKNLDQSDFGEENKEEENEWEIEDEDYNEEEVNEDHKYEMTDTQWKEKSQSITKEPKEVLTKKDLTTSKQPTYHLDDNGVLTFPDTTTIIPSDYDLMSKRKAVKVVDLSNLNGLSSLKDSNNREIGSWATNVQKVILPESITRIEAGAFEDCENLTEIIMSDKVTEIEEHAFEGCEKLKNFKFPSSLKSIRKEAFTRCYGFTELCFPDSLETIAESAFSYCDRVKEISFGQSLKSIGKDAFYGCDSLRTVRYTSPVSDIDERAFGFMYHEFESIYDYEIDYNYLKVNSWSELEKYRDQDPLQLKVVDLSGCRLKELPFNAFSDCENLKKVILPEGLKEISANAFYGCHSLKSIEIPESVEVINYSFDESGIEEVTLPRNLRSLYTSGLKYIDMSRCESIRVLSKDNFGIHEAEVVYLPPFLEKIGRYGCLSKIEYCFAPPTLKSIGDVKEVGFFCTSPKIDLSRDIDRSLLHVPTANLEFIKAAAQKAGLRESRFQVLEMPYTFEFMYES